MAKGIQLADLIIQASVVQLLILAIAVLKQYAYVVKTYLEGIVHRAPPPGIIPRGLGIIPSLLGIILFKLGMRGFLPRLILTKS